jgi:uncharacterized membrane protein YdjX (TVP38/TMEM64 family)
MPDVQGNGSAVPAGNSGRRGDWLRPLALAALVAGSAVAAEVFHLDERIAGLQEWIRGLGAWGPAAFVGIYAAAALAVVPQTILMLAAGVLFGPWTGTVTVSIGSTLGASLCFLVSRHLAREATARWLGRSGRFRRLDAMTVRHGALVVALTRLIPFFPYNMTNFAFGLTSVRFLTYVFWSWLCMLPATFIFVAGGDILGDLLVLGFRRESVDLQVLAVLALDLVLVALVAALARSRIREDRDRDGATGRPDEKEG